MSTSAEPSAIFNKKIRQRYSKTDIIEALELAANGSSDSGIYVPKTGGAFTGDITAPNLAYINISNSFSATQTISTGATSESLTIQALNANGAYIVYDDLSTTVGLKFGGFINRFRWLSDATVLADLSTNLFAIYANSTTIDGTLDVSQDITANNLNITNWDTAFGWGDWSTGVTKTFVDALGVNATSLGGEPLTRFMLLDDSPVPVFADGDVPVYQIADQTFTNLTLSTVATTNSYDDLDDKPTIYASWTISDGSNTEAVIDGFTLEIVGQGIATTSYSAIDNRLTISATEADTLDTVTGRGATTSNNVTVGNLNAAVITGTGSFSLPKISSDLNGVLVQDVLTLNPITTTERNALTATEGMLIANSTTNALEYYNGTSWV